MNAADVMVSNVITVGPDATVQEVAGILLKNKISAVPVVSQIGKILGIVSEGDMLRRVESIPCVTPLGGFSFSRQIQRLGTSSLSRIRTKLLT